MRKMTITFIFIGLIQFLSGCSQGYRSNAHQIQQAQQQQAQIQAYQNQQRINQARQNKQRVERAKVPQKSNHASQQTHANAIVNKTPTRNLMTRIAQSTIGKPYKWGGSNPQQGFDCSGLMTYVHENALGIKIPRTAAQQRDKSRTISYAQLQPGDMLFFKTGKNSNHVGVYVGDRKFVHAATGSKQVKVASMDSSYWHKRFVKFGTFL